MQPDIASLIDTVQRQERRNRSTAIAIVSASVLASAALFVVTLQLYPKWVALLVIVCTFPLLLWVPGVGGQLLPVLSYKKFQ